MRRRPAGESRGLGPGRVEEDLAAMWRMERTETVAAEGGDVDVFAVAVAVAVVVAVAVAAAVAVDAVEGAAPGGNAVAVVVASEAVGEDGAAGETAAAGEAAGNSGTGDVAVVGMGRMGRQGWRVGR